MTLESQPLELNALAARAYARIRASNALPSPSRTASKTLRTICAKDATEKAVVEALESDPVTAKRILRLVNTPLAGASPHVASISEAVQRLGTRALKSLVVGISLVGGQKKVPCAGFAHDKFWSESVGRATAARHVAHKTNGFSPYEAFALGLLSRIGCLAFATAYRVAYSHILDRVGADNPNGLARLERSLFDLDHNELSAEMMGNWGIAAECCEAVRHQDGAAAESDEHTTVAVRLARTLHLAASIASVLAHPEVELEGLNRLVNEASRLGIQPADFHTVFDSISSEWRDVAAIFAVAGRKVPPLATLYSQAFLHHRTTG